MSTPQSDLETRINIALAVASYLRAVDRFDMASQAMTTACSDLRAKLERPSRFVVRVEFRHYLIHCDEQGNFDLEQIEVL